MGTGQDLHPFSVLIVAGGSGTRLGGAIPKQYQEINGISVLEQSIKTFISCKNLKNIRLVCAPAHHETVQDTVLRYALPPASPSGRTRKNSVFNGLNDFFNLKDEDIILIHDAARPFVTVQEIQSLVAAVAAEGAATLAIPVSDTLSREDGTTIDRTGLWAVQTPQGFSYGLLRQAHETFKAAEGFTDDASLVRALGHKVVFVPGHRRNFKITTPDDLALARELAA